MIRALIPSFQVGGFEKFPNFHSWEYLGVHPPVDQWEVEMNQASQPQKKAPRGFPREPLRFPPWTKGVATFIFPGRDSSIDRSDSFNCLWIPRNNHGFLGWKNDLNLEIKKNSSNPRLPLFVAFHVSLAAKHPPQTHIGFRSKNINPARDD